MRTKVHTYVGLGTDVTGIARQSLDVRTSDRVTELIGSPYLDWPSTKKRKNQAITVVNLLDY